ncbi:hypothetical protein K6119_00030 [Paracrocinitomix mangrovi]|uniref:hypothetical protein n=1 Tax=Paracrocinitomix mangrovi TaxID=2862509 RepID=UPI001C8DF7A9|nr:hypothetical protein [Paracrocinitomix mangrovi]UKN01902.1 hypothetical protein K6119_00030 [Paracrocinitomix mangrovi]
MKTKALFPLTLILFTLLMGSCTKTVDPVWMVYQEENCRPPWVAKTDNKTRKNLEALLKGDGIIPLKIKIKGDRDNNCQDCFCLTGKSYHVQVDESQMGYMFYYGFSVEN